VSGCSCQPAQIVYPFVYPKSDGWKLAVSCHYMWCDEYLWGWGGLGAMADYAVTN
jgi:hypothetical protein